MRKTADFIIKFRYVFLAIFIALTVYAIFGMGWVEVEYSITEYLPADTDTKKALDIMDTEFPAMTDGSTRILLTDVSKEDALDLRDRIAALDGIKTFGFDGSEMNYKEGYALFDITFEGSAEDAQALAAYDAVLAILGDTPHIVVTEMHGDYIAEMEKMMTLIVGIAAAVILIVLLLTSKSYAEIIAFPFVFVIAALLNMGTNYWFGKISFVSNMVCIILQLALSIDYSIILCHRFTDEKRLNTDAKKAMAAALSKAIPEILSSCLTTVAGLLALVTMTLRLGADVGLVMTKSILFSILTVFLFMPCVLVLLSPLIDKSMHRSFLPKMTFIGKIAVKGRYVLPALYLVIVIVFGVFSFRLPYAYSMQGMKLDNPSEQELASRKIDELFGYTNTFAVLVPRGDYGAEKQILDYVGSREEVDLALGLANIVVDPATGITATTPIGVEEFNQFTGMKLGALLFRSYAQANGDTYSADYRVPLIDIADYAIVFAAELGVSTSGFADVIAMLDEAKQLRGTHFSRLVFNIDAMQESPEAFAFYEDVRAKVLEICPEAIFAGETVSAYDLSKSFETDNVRISVLTVAFIFLILLLTFWSWGLPILLVAIIQGAIFINFGFIAMTGGNVFFFVYIIISAIQMGATIDYAIVMTNHYRQERKTGADARASAIAAVTQSFPTIITSGIIMTTAAFLIGGLINDSMIASIGTMLGRGTIVSVLSVLFVLPSLLCLFDKWMKYLSLPHLGRRRKTAPLVSGGGDLRGAERGDAESAREDMQFKDAYTEAEITAVVPAPEEEADEIPFGVSEERNE